MPRRSLRCRVATGLIAVCAALGAALPLEPIRAFQESAGADMQLTHLDNGAELWEPRRTEPKRSLLMQLWEGVYDVVFPNPEDFPFDRSIALLVGVSEYSNLRDLPYVRNDIDDLRDYLLAEAGFDAVYILRDRVATPDLIEEYMINEFASLGSRDRLLFYYAGHGADIGGTTGYIQFADTPHGRFSRPDQLAIRARSLEWSRVIDAGHLLIVFDACASGFGFTARDSGDSRVQLLHALSGNGSRAVITAGTADERTYEVEGPDGRGNGVFTGAFLNALRDGASAGSDGLVTTSELIAAIKNEVARFADESGVTLNPQLWELDRAEYRGTFVFLNPSANPSNLLEAYRVATGAVPRGAGLDPPDPLPPPRDPVPEPRTPPVGTDYGTFPDGFWLGSPQDYFVEIPSGSFVMGSDPGRDSNAKPYEQPAHRVDLPGYFIGRYEVTVAQFRAFVDDDSGFEVGDRGSLEGLDDRPVTSVSWDEALAYCNWLTAKLRAWEGTPRPLRRVLHQEGGRVTLPSEAEWEKAARGTSGGIYPWGDALDTTRANYLDTEILTTTAVGSYRAGATPEEVFDLAGNVQEWTRSLVRPYPYRRTDGREDVSAPGARMLRGGSFFSPEHDVRAASRLLGTPVTRQLDIGFRVVVSSSSSGR